MAEKAQYPPASAPQGGYPEAPPSYEASMAQGATGGGKFAICPCFRFFTFDSLQVVLLTQAKVSSRLLPRHSNSNREDQLLHKLSLCSIWILPISEQVL